MLTVNPVVGTRVSFWYVKDNSNRLGVVHAVKPNKAGQDVLTIVDETEGNAYRSFHRAWIEDYVVLPS